MIFNGTLANVYGSIENTWPCKCLWVHREYMALQKSVGLLQSPKIPIENNVFSLEKIQVVFSVTEAHLDGDRGSTKSFANVILWEPTVAVFGLSLPNGNGYGDQTLPK